MLEFLKPVLVPIHSAGWPYIAIFASLTVIGGLIWSPLYVLGAILTTWCAYFFRDPMRTTPTRPGLIISPADGIIQLITEAVPPPELDMPLEPLTRISIFMNVFDVHVNRSPVDGQVSTLGYRAGRFLNASLDKASEENERQAVKIRTEDGREIGIVQIAGLVARRILCWVQRDQPLRVGERFGMIRFGSRVDIFLPRGVAPLVLVGQRAVAGETVLADMVSDEPSRKGLSR
ncbi:MAG: phosphatidylserine decarboxylase [Pseudomonadota bacterium]|nr:phosphatidylserine decarboxylase [Pseudomonadota bacterium]